MSLPIQQSLLGLELELHFKMKIFFSIFILFISFTVNSYSQIAYIDINFILNTSQVGKSLNKYITEIRDENSIDQNQIEKILVKKEKELVAQQNIIDKSEFEKKLSNLSKEVNQYRVDKKRSQDFLNTIKLKNTKKILELLNPIITEYVELNSISLVIPKKNIVVGKKSLDITSDVIILLDNKVSTFSFK